MNANESFELAASAFTKASGNLPPGKDGCTRSDVTMHDWKIWCAAVEYMQRVRDHATKCAACHGKKVLEDMFGNETYCYYCEGTGKGAAE